MTTPRKTPPVPASTGEPTPPEKKPHNPFAHVGKTGWGDGGQYIVGKDGLRHPVETKTGNGTAQPVPTTPQQEEK